VNFALGQLLTINSPSPSNAVDRSAGAMAFGTRFRSAHESCSRRAHGFSLPKWFHCDEDLALRGVNFGQDSLPCGHAFWKAFTRRSAADGVVA